MVRGLCTKVFSLNTALKISSKCSLTAYASLLPIHRLCDISTSLVQKLRFFADFRLVLKENPIRAKASYKNHYCHGFTLMELMIAIVIFSIMSTIAFTGLHTILNTREKTDLAALELKNLQTTMTFLRQDIEQTVERKIRDGFGDSRAALHGDISSLYSLELTRAGNSNPLKLPRSNLKRVAYKLSDDKFYRITWKTLDRAQESEPYILELLNNVTNLEIRFLDEKKQWHSSWPPITISDNEIAGLPLAVEVNLTLEKWGEIVRIFQVAGKHEVENQDI